MKRQFLFAICVAACSALPTYSAHAQYKGQTLTVASFGGNLDKMFQKIFAPFEKKYDVTIRWAPGNSSENAAKVIASKARPEIDVVGSDDIGYENLSKMGLLSKFDPAIMTNYADLHTQAKFRGMDGIPIGFFFTGFFYNNQEFQKRGWAPPKSWNDLFRPEFCNQLGILNPSVSYTMHMLVMLAGGDLNKVATEAIPKLAKLKGCIATLEPSSAKLEEKIQLGEYLVGVYGTSRLISIAQTGYPVRFALPEEGGTLSSTAFAATKGGNEKLAQEFLNWFVSPDAQKILVEEGNYLPSNSKVTVPAKLLDYGMPSADAMAKAIPIDAEAVAKDRREWNRQVERALTP